MNLPVRSSVNFISNLVIEQDFATLPNGQRVLVKDNMIAELGALKKYHNMLVKRTTTYTGFDFSPIADERFDQREIPREGVPQIKDETFWAQHRTDTLTRSEAGMSTMVRDMTRKKGFGWILWIVRAFVENYVETSPPGKKNYVDFGPVNTVVSSNFIDKVRLRASAQTTANLNPHLFLKGYVAYGIRDRKWKYEGEIEYSFLKNKFSLTPIDASLWKFLRLRPQNFPHIRIAQLANLVYSKKLNMSAIVEASDLQDMHRLLDTQVSEYWQTHYTFASAQSAKTEKRLSNSSKNLLIINTLCPMLFAYGKYKNDEALCEKSLNMLQEIKPEDNHITRAWNACGVTAESAADSQALIQLEQNYCSTHNCLRCRFGYEFIRQNPNVFRENKNKNRILPHT